LISNLPTGSVTYESTVVFNNAAYANAGPMFLSTFYFRYDAWPAGGVVTLTAPVVTRLFTFEAIAVPDHTTLLTCAAASISILATSADSRASSVHIP
jgi:hypothetical protein